MNLTTVESMSSLINLTGGKPSEPSSTYLRDEECLKILFESRENLCFDSRLAESLERFAKKYGDSDIEGYKPVEFIISPMMKHVVGKIMIYLAKFVYMNKDLKKWAQKLDDVIDNEQPAYDIYTEYISQLSSLERILIILPNFYEEAVHISEDDLLLLSTIIDKCGNVRIWICGEDNRDDQRHSIYQRFYDRFNPVSWGLFDAIKKGKTPPYVYFSYNWEVKSDEIVDKLTVLMRRNGLPYKRDKENCKYRDDIHEFMNKIREGKYVVILLSKPYLESFYCMYELVGVISHEDYKDRIIPLVTDNSIRDDGYYYSLCELWSSRKHDRMYKSQLKKKGVKRFYLREKDAIIDDILETLQSVKDYVDAIDTEDFANQQAHGFVTIAENIKNLEQTRV